MGVETLDLTYLIFDDYARTTGGWIYNERVLTELAVLGWQVDRREPGPGIPDPSPVCRAAALTMLHDLPDSAIVLADQVCLAPLAEMAALHAERLNLVMIVHHPQILEASRPPEVAARLDAGERAALRLARLVIATSRLTARQLMDGYGVSADQLVVAEPGTDVLAPSPGSGGGPGVHLLSIGSVIPRKRHELIVAALSGLTDLDWRLTIVGNLDRALEHVAALRDLIDKSGLSDRVALAGERTGPELDALWAGADIYAAAATHEGFGMAVAEAVARQVPVVSTRSGAVGEWLESQAGIMVEPDDITTFRAALRQVITDPSIRNLMRDGAKAARAALPTWPQAGAKVDAALRQIM